jgi:hypothetical protein
VVSHVDDACGSPVPRLVNDGKMRRALFLMERVDVRRKSPDFRRAFS